MTVAPIIVACSPAASAIGPAMRVAERHQPDGREPVERRDAGAGPPPGCSRPSVVSHSVKPTATATPLSTWAAAMAAVEPASAMIAGWQAAQHEGEARGQHRVRRLPAEAEMLPAIVPTPKLAVIAAHDAAPSSSRAASTGAERETHGSAIQW